MSVARKRKTYIQDNGTVNMTYELLLQSCYWFSRNLLQRAPYLSFPVQLVSNRLLVP